MQDVTKFYVRMNFMNIKCVLQKRTYFYVNGWLTLFIDAETFLVLDESDYFLIIRLFSEIKFFDYFKDVSNELEVFRDVLEEMIIVKLYLIFPDFLFKPF